MLSATLKRTHVLLWCFVVAGASAAPALAAPLPPDPVEDFRRALKDERDAIRDQQVLAHRRATLTRKAVDLKSLGDMSRVLLLQEWRVDSKDEAVATLDSAIRDLLAQRFGERAREVLRSEDPLRRVAAAELIGETVAAARQLGPKTAFLRFTGAGLAPDLVRLARDPVPAVRAAAAKALGKIEPDSSTGEIAGLFGGLSSAVALSTQRAGLGTVAATLESHLNDPAQSVRQAAADALSNLVQVTAQQEKRSRGVTRASPYVRYDLLATGARVVPAAATGLDAAQSRDVRKACIDACQQVTASLLELVPEQTDLQPQVPTGRPLTAEERRRFAEDRVMLEADINELQPIGNAFRLSIPAINAASLDADPAIRLQARRVLDELAAVRGRLLHREQSLPRTDDRPKISGAALEQSPSARRPDALPDFGLPVSQEVAPRPKPVVPEADGPDSIRQALRQSVPALIEGLRDPVARNRLAAVEALETLEDEAESAIPALVKRLGDSNLFVRWASARTLGRFAPAHADLIVPALIPLLKSDDLDQRVATANALARFGPLAAPAASELGRAASSGDPEIRFAAMRALESVGTTAESQLPSVVRNLDHPNPQVRVAACRTLSRFGDASSFAVPRLKRAMSDSDGDVRRAAAEAVLTITKQAK